MSLIALKGTSIRRLKGYHLGGELMQRLEAYRW